MKFSIVIVTYNRKKDLEKCLESIQRQNIQHPFEVIVVFNGELSYLDKTKVNYPTAKCFYTPSATPSSARNFGITKCKGEYIFFLDDDCTLPPDYFSQLLFDNWDVMGGPDQTSPESSEFQKTLGLVLASPFCMGRTRLRHSPLKQDRIVEADESKLILCNLWIKRTIFSEDNHYFDHELFRNEENFLLKKLKIEGKKMFYNPAMFVYHRRRDTYGLLATAVLKSGECRVLNFLKLPVKSELIYFLPIFFNILLLTWLFNLSSMLSMIFIPYFILVYLFGFWKSKSLKLNFLFMHLFILFMYSMGLSKGFFQYGWILLRDFNKEYS